MLQDDLYYINYGAYISMSGRAKHDRSQFISEYQRFTAVMLRPYEYIGIIGSEG
jgi:hypothetical protein